MTREELAAKADISVRSVVVYEKDERLPDRPRIWRGLADALGVTVDEMKSWLPDLDNNTTIPRKMQAVPEFEANVAAGGWVHVGEGYDFGAGKIAEAGRFVIEVRGTSMEPQYPDGCRVQFRKVTWDREPLMPGLDYYVCRGQQGEHTFKVLRRASSDGLELISRNREQHPEVLFVELQNIASVAVAEHKLERVEPLDLVDVLDD